MGYDGDEWTSWVQQDVRTYKNDDVAIDSKFVIHETRLECAIRGVTSKERRDDAGSERGRKIVKTVNIHMRRICSLIHWPCASSQFDPVSTHPTPSLPHHPFPMLIG